MKYLRFRSNKDTARILLDEELVDPQQVADAREMLSEGRCTIGRALVEVGLVSEWDMARVTCKEFALPFVHVRESAAGDVNDVFDREDLHRHLFFVMDQFDEIHSVVVCEPPTSELLDLLVSKLGERVQLLVAQISEVEKVLETSYPLAVAKQAPADDPVEIL